MNKEILLQKNSEIKQAKLALIEKRQELENLKKKRDQEYFSQEEALKAQYKESKDEALSTKEKREAVAELNDPLYGMINEIKAKEIKIQQEYIEIESQENELKIYLSSY